MDIVLGVSMAPTSVRMLLVEGENADGVTVEDNEFDIATDDDAATLSAADQVISAILGTREGATEAGHALTSTGVTWTDPVDAAGLHEALATRKIENVMLVSAFMAAAALAQTVANTVGYHHTALLFLEPDTATLAVVDSADGAISDVHKELIPGDSVAELAGMLAGLDELETRPQSVFIVGTGVDVAAIKPQLETLTALPVTAAEEPETALAWGAGWRRPTHRCLPRRPRPSRTRKTRVPGLSIPMRCRRDTLQRRMFRSVPSWVKRIWRTARFRMKRPKSTPSLRMR